jgi:hypothetical protein
MSGGTRVEVVREVSEALAPGADLWVVANLENSSWSQKIDWYLNFQILRAKTHQTAAPDSEMNQVLSRWEVEIPPAENLSSSPLMIVSSSSLPNHAVVMVPFEVANLRRWVEQVHGVWRCLDAPSLRVFLPNGQNAVKFAKAWPGPEDVLVHAIVVEPS